MPSERATRFVAHLTTLDRAALAALRRGLAFDPGTHVPSFPYVEPFASEDGWARTVHYLVAGLYALHPSHADGRTLGATTAELHRRRENRHRESGSLEARFLALLDADATQLANRLRQIVSLVRSEEIPIDWARLETDLIYWNCNNRSVQRKWARDFYRAPAATETADAEQPTDETE